MTSDSIVIIPTYNEKENIEKIIRAVFQLEKKFNILVIDDGSPDGTAQIVHNLIKTEFSDCLFIIERKTAALFESCAAIGAESANASDEEV